MIIFVEFQSNPRLYIVNTPSVPAWFRAVTATSEKPPRLLGMRPATGGAWLAFMERFKADRISEHWYRRSPELMRFIEEAPDTVSRPAGRPSRLTDETVLAVFHEAHRGHVSDGELGARYGISNQIVGRIARGAYRSRLFQTEISESGTFMLVWPRTDSRERAYSVPVGRRRR